MAGLVLGHTHLYSALARGMPPPKKQPRNFLEILKEVWWKLDLALDEEAVEVSARVGAVEALLAGVTTVIDHHASPNFIEGSLFAVRRGVDAVGLRSVLAYEITDRHGKAGRDAGLAETERFLESGRTARCRALVGGHASMTLEPDSLELMGDLAQRYDVGLHVHVAEDPEDERDCRQKYDLGLAERFNNYGLLGPRTLLAHCTHLAWEELSLAQQSGTWLLHCPRSNMNNGVGYAPAGRFGARKALGTDGISADLFEEARTAFFRGRDAGVDLDILRWLTGGHLLASELFGMPIGRLEAGAAADLLVLDYPSPTPLTEENLAGHVLFG
ncbi:MAG: amidohydrolase family protein, partial [Myxococcales bacterium]